MAEVAAGICSVTPSGEELLHDYVPIGQVEHHWIDPNDEGLDCDDLTSMACRYCTRVVFLYPDEAIFRPENSADGSKP